MAKFIPLPLATWNARWVPRVDVTVAIAFATGAGGARTHVTTGAVTILQVQSELDAGVTLCRVQLEGSQWSSAELGGVGDTKGIRRACLWAAKTDENDIERCTLPYG